MATEIATQEQIAEYESQLAGINELLVASPEDASLLELKKDMEELLALSKSSLEGNDQQESSTDAASVTEGEVAAGPASTGAGDPDSLDDLELPTTLPQAVQSPGARKSFASAYNSHVDVNLEEAMEKGAAQAAAASADEASPDDNQKKSKKKEKIKDFVLPPHLIPNEGDSEAELNRKRRAAKALKNKWRQRKKEVESTNKQKSWQSFQKKAKRKGGDDGESIFSTKDGVSDRVGVVSKKTMTEFGSRKRHKHT